ncbi:VOC family protein [Primorskyibacter aestuariivivens]|uniref:VOC family protein n=1 Tax=Primorskyibacter aestuariivivens TaxID=1888912 RepID=UPI0023008BDE|nr:VOC family protein [Primorskyibacter aestuariivivens]MDA7430857.1 VOC family protein [Primorskyibacter aestuariivivens]
MTTGIHHATGITANVQANVDFYTGFLGLRLIKRTGGFEDAEQLHLFYGDATGTPGTLVSFLVWESGGRGRIGHGQVAEIAFAVPPASMGDWLTRAMDARVPVEGPKRAFGEPVLRLKDPDGLIVKLVGADHPATAPLFDPVAPTRLHSVTILSERPDETAEFVSRFGYKQINSEGAIRRLTSDSDAVDVRDASGFVPSIPGAGIMDHVAFRAPDADAMRCMRMEMKDVAGMTNVHDRKYFLSLYVREPAGTLIEYATDGPGFAVDEPLDHLGETLFVPPQDAKRAQDLKLLLPQFAMPGEERFPMRDLPFIHRFHRPENPDGSTILLLHGTGGSESDLMPLAHRVNPRATLLGVRGRATEEGNNRWFRRFDAVTYDQADIHAEAEAFAAFVRGAMSGYGLDERRLCFVGYSNGANLLGAVLQLHPQTIRHAILLRPVQVLEDPPKADLEGASVLMLIGSRDPFARMAPALERALREGGVNVEVRASGAGHDLTPEDVSQASDWLFEQGHRDNPAV